MKYSILSIAVLMQCHCQGTLTERFFKIGISPSKKVAFIYFNESPLKMMKKKAYFKLKAFSILEIFKFLSRLFGYVEKRVDKRAKVSFKIMTWQPGQRKITKSILSNSSSIKATRQ